MVAHNVYWTDTIGAALEINRRWFTCRNNPRRVSLHRRPVQETLTKCICGIGTCHSQFNLSWHTLVLLWLWPSNDHLWTYVGVAPTLGRRPRGGFNALVLFPAFSNNCWPSFTNQDGDTYEGFCSCCWWFTLTAGGAGGHGVNVVDVVSYSCACGWSFPEARPGWRCGEVEYKNQLEARVMLLGMDGEKEPEHALDESKLLSAVFQVVDRTSVPHVPLLNIFAFMSSSSSTPHTLVFHAGI